MIINVTNEELTKGIDWRHGPKKGGPKSAEYEVRLHISESGQKRTSARLVITFGHIAMERLDKGYKRVRVSEFGNNEKFIYFLFTKAEDDKDAYKFATNKGCPRACFSISAAEYKALVRLWESEDDYTLYHEGGDLYYIQAKRKQ